MDRFEIANRIQAVINNAHPEYCDRHTLRECVKALRKVQPEASEVPYDGTRHAGLVPDYDEDAINADADAIMPQIRAALEGKHRAAVGVVLAEATARWLCGHPKEIRNTLMRLQISTTLAIVEELEKPNEQG